MMKRFLLLGFAALWLLTVAGARAAQVHTSGHVGYSTYGSRVQIFIEELTNFSDAPTDRLRLRLWASEDHWSQYDPGELMAFTLLPRLNPYETRHDLHPRVGWHRPPNGWYYVTLTLEERVIDESGKHWELRDVIEFDGQRYFRRNYVGWPFPF